MKKITLLIALMISSLGFSQTPEGTWKLSPAAGAFQVGPTQGSNAWWQNSADDVNTRVCQFDDEFIFSADGSFLNVLQSSTWVEWWQNSGPEGCGTPVAPHDGTNPATWAYSASNSTITLNGLGAYLGLSRAVNAGELSASTPLAIPASRIYIVSTLTNTNMTLDIECGTGVWWRFNFVKQTELTNFSFPNKLIGSGSFTITPPTTASTGALTYSSSNTSVATISGSTVTILGVGTTIITVNQAATENYSAGSTSALLSVYQPSPILTATGNQTYCAGTSLNIAQTANITPNSLDPSATSTSLPVAIQFVSGYVSGKDIVMLTGNNPTSIKASTFDPAQGKLTLSSSTVGVPVSFADLEIAIKNIQFSTNSKTPGKRDFTITLEGMPDYNPVNFPAATTSISVFSVNQAPTIGQISDISMNQNLPQQTVNLSGIADGEIVASQNITITATSNNTALIPTPTVTYSPNATTGLLQFTPVANGSGSAIITLTVQDDGGVVNCGMDTTVKTFTIIVNSTPTDIMLSANSLAENLNNRVIGNLSAMDVDVADSFTYKLVSGVGDTGNTNFTIVNGNQLQNLVSFDFETQPSYSIRVQVKDGGENIFEKILTIGVGNLNDIAITSSAINSYCSGSISINTVTNTSGVVNYSWTASNGGFIQNAEKSTANLTNLPNGTYAVTISDNYFSYSKSFQITLITQYQNLSVCYVTSDETDVTKNRIFINNQGNYNVGFYEILRETNISNYYSSIGTITSSEISFLDANSDNTAKAYRYKVRLVDNCGNASPNSAFQKTILLQSTVAINNSVSLSWTHYEGITYGTYNIYRKTNLGPFELIGSIASTDNAYNDQTANVLTNKYEYYVAIDVSTCATSVAGKIKAVSAIKSNLQKLGNSLSINANMLSSEIILYPNPASSKVVLKMPESIEFNGLEIYNTIGQRIKSFKEKEFLVDFLPSGTYLIKIFTDQGTAVKNFIKE